MTKNPSVKLHPELREYAMSLVRNNIPLTQIQMLCHEWASAKWGPDKAGDAQFRYMWNAKDSTSLYRSHAQELGIPQRSTAEENLDRWFRSENPLPPNPILTQSCLHYQPHIEDESDRFEIILCTPQQREMAWKYGHKGQIIMDLTFGVCSARALLVILMVIDENNHGLPVAFFLFTARREAQATHADYDGALLQRLLHRWKVGMGKNSAGEEFSILVANTDNDHRERHALESNWPDVFLVLCLFHTYQAWRNGLNKHLRIIPQGLPRQQTRRRLGRFLMRLLQEINEYDDAVLAYNDEVKYFKDISKQRTALARKVSKGGLAFLSYLRNYIKLESFWLSWSKAGAVRAAAYLNQKVDRVARTTNHVESFNGRIKGKYFAAYRHSGRLPRIDMWILTMLTKVLPSFFQNQQDKVTLDDYYGKLRTIGPFFAKASPLKDTPDGLDDKIILEQLLDNSEASGESTAEESDSEEGISLPLEIELAPHNDHLVDDSINLTPDSPLTPLSEDSHSLDDSLPFEFDANIILADDSICPETPDAPGAQHLSELDVRLPLCPDTAFRRTRNRNSEVTCMQRILQAEDLLVQELRLFLQIADNPDALTPHISPSIHTRLFNPLDAPIELDLPEKKTSVSPALELTKRDTTNNHRLIPLPRQLKEKRHEAHGIR